MTLPTRPNAIFSTLQSTQNFYTKPPLQKELKIPKHSPPNSAGKHLSSFIQLSNNKSLLSNQATPSRTNQCRHFSTDEQRNWIYLQMKISKQVEKCYRVITDFTFLTLKIILDD